MKRILLILVACIVLGATVAANAEIIPVTNTDDSTTLGYLAVTHGPVVDGYEEIALNWDSFVGEAAGSKQLNIGGTWTAGGGAFYLYDGANWSPRTMLDSYYEPPTPPLSYVNFASKTGAFTRGPETSGNAYTWFHGDCWMAPGGENWMWLTPVDPDLGDGFDQTLLAKLYITPGATFSFAGESGFSYGGGTTPHIYFETVPEPSTFALLAAGLLGLLCYAWRKRK